MESDHAQHRPGGAMAPLSCLLSIVQGLAWLTRFGQPALDEERFMASGQKPVEGFAGKKVALAGFGFKRAQIFSWQMGDPFQVDGPLHDIAEDGHIEIDGAGGSAGLLAGGNKTVDVDAFDLFNRRCPRWAFQ